MNILITTLGTTWAIIPELFGFTNPDDYPLFANHPEHDSIAKQRLDHQIQPVSQIWIATTSSTKLENLITWQHQTCPNITLNIFRAASIEDLASVDECHRMTDLIYRIALHASETAQDGHVYYSLTGGRKTMSADMQQAASIFGSNALFHVVDRRMQKPDRERFDNPDLFHKPLSATDADKVIPVITHPAQPANYLLHTLPAITAAKYPLPLHTDNQNTSPPKTDLYDEITQRLSRARDLYFNYTRNLISEKHHSNFQLLFALPPETIERLQNTQIGLRSENQTQDMKWIKSLPKAELHCHFGGLLSPGEMIEVARANQPAIEQAKQTIPDFNNWCAHIQDTVNHQDLATLKDECHDSGKHLRQRFPAVPEPLAVCAFLSAFYHHPQLLEQLIFGQYLDPGAFHGVCIATYESLGDLQGSGLMQTEASLRTACRIHARHCRDHHICYSELRCSPCNYTRGGLSAEQVSNIICDELLKHQNHTTFKLILIASRHGKISQIHRHVDLAQALLAQNTDFSKMFAGFDLAGNEKIGTPEELRPAFIPLMQECFNLTIHAGEGESADNIWQAVYHLNADRIGHGLTLAQAPDLIKRFLNRRICIEMCPSSNRQIIGYKHRFLPQTQHYQTYPLTEYLERGLKVTVNTDDPGISQTNLSNEYYQAACLAPNGLSQWQLLQLVRNSFRNAFADIEQREKLLKQTEQTIYESLISND